MAASSGKIDRRVCSEPLEQQINSLHNLVTAGISPKDRVFEQFDRHCSQILRHHRIRLAINLELRIEPARRFGRIYQRKRRNHNPRIEVMVYQAALQLFASIFPPKTVFSGA